MINLKFWRKAAPAVGAAPAVPDTPGATKIGGMKISDVAVLTVPGAEIPRGVAFKAPDVPPGVIPAQAKLACDSAMTQNYAFAVQGAYSEGLEFMGYAYLSELTQRPEYRRPAEILAKEMTREWIKLQAIGDDPTGAIAEKLRKIEAEMKRLGVQAAFQKAAEQDGYFGRSQIYLDTGSTDDLEELKIPLSETAEKIGIGMLKAITVIEPIWTYPNAYNSTDPLKHDFFRPQNWFVMGKEVHASRLLTFVSRPVPDMLKPSYAFGGLSLSQISKPYVDNWLRTRQSVSDLISNFSVMGVKTDLSTVLNGGGSEMMNKRAQLFNQTRNNRGLMMLNKDTEEFFNVSAPLASLDKLQAQSQEHMAAVDGIPLVILLGITPTGLNASSEGELETFYAWTKAQQEALFTPQLSKLINVIQLSLFGEIDPAIGFKYMPLWTLSEVEQATARKTEADTDIAYIGAGVITPDESRARLAGQEDGPYSSLDLSEELPEVPEPESGPLRHAEEVSGQQEEEDEALAA
jgi:phage-related protein (TIGR01555 family)